MLRMPPKSAENPTIALLLAALDPAAEHASSNSENPAARVVAAQARLDVAAGEGTEHIMMLATGILFAAAAVTEKFAAHQDIEPGELLRRLAEDVPAEGEGEGLVPRLLRSFFPDEGTDLRTSLKGITQTMAGIWDRSESEFFDLVLHTAAFAATLATSLINRRVYTLDEIVKAAEAVLDPTPDPS